MFGVNSKKSRQGKFPSYSFRVNINYSGSFKHNNYDYCIETAFIRFAVIE